MKTRKGQSMTRFIAAFKQAVELEATKTNKKLAAALVEEVTDAIERQTYDWEPLKPKYLDKKIEQGYDPRTLVRTREYLDSISWGVTGGKIWAGIKMGSMHSSGLPMAKLARIHEFGTAVVPARPLWRPALSIVLRRNKKYRSAYRAAIRRATKSFARRGVK